MKQTDPYPREVLLDWKVCDSSSGESILLPPNHPTTYCTKGTLRARHSLPSYTMAKKCAFSYSSQILLLRTNYICCDNL